jgi:hypothetical protein
MGFGSKEVNPLSSQVFILSQFLSRGSIPAAGGWLK